jgi:hypothetical protein
MRQRTLPPVPVLDAPGNAFPFADIPELGAEALPPEALAHLQQLDAATLEALAEIAISILDARAVDPELEDDDEDCDESGEDVGSKAGSDASSFTMRGAEHGPGDPDDGEEDDAPEDDDPLEADPDSPIFPFNVSRFALERPFLCRASLQAGFDHDDNEDRGSDGS